MSDLRKAAEMALEALEWNYGTDLENIENCMAWLDKMNATIPALRQALAQPEWVGLTDEEAWGVYRTHGLSFHRPNHVEEYEWALCMRDFARDIEAKLKEKNT